MRTAFAITLLSAASAASAAGPISKFDGKPPVGEYQTDRQIEDIERCLIDMDGWLAPNVYRQPDRPNAVTLIWIAGGKAPGLSAARVDLIRKGNRTQARSWMPAKQAEACIKG